MAANFMGKIGKIGLVTFIRRSRIPMSVLTAAMTWLYHVKI